jgi:hypothetical protein
MRSLSKAHKEHPFEFDGMVVGYEPAESDAKLKGGNSNWRGPIWFPTSFLLIESLRKLGKAFGPRFAVATPASGGQPITFAEMAREIASRLIRIFTRDAAGRRPAYGGTEKFQNDSPTLPLSHTEHSLTQVGGAMPESFTFFWSGPFSQWHPCRFTIDGKVYTPSST